MKKTYTLAFIIALVLGPISFWGGFKLTQAVDTKLISRNKKVVIETSNQEAKNVYVAQNITENIPENNINPTKTDEIENESLETTEPENNEKPNIIEDNNSKFSFVIIGDTQGFNPGNPNGSFQKAVSNINKNNVDLVFALGDLISSCEGGNKCRDKLISWKNTVGPLFSKTYVMQGNHDRIGRDEADKVWADFFNMTINGPDGYKEFAYSLDFANSHFVVLNSDKPKEFMINSTQRSWLEQDLARNKKENTFVFFHEPAYPVSNKIGEGLDTHPKERNELWNILIRHKVTAVFSGHEHIQSRKNANGIYQFIFGNTDTFLHDLPKAGMAEYCQRVQGFGIVEVDGKKITVKTYSVDGNLLDNFILSK